MKQATGNRQQATGNNPPGREQGTERLEALLKRAMPPVGEDDAPGHDLWPAMQARMKSGGEVAERIHAVPWFDWALAGAVALSVVAFPAMIPVLLYYL